MFKTPRSDMKAPLSESHPDFESLATPDERAAAERARRSVERSEEQAYEALGLKKDIRARFKIEVKYVNERKVDGTELARSINGPNLCGVTIWESGKRLNGGGDDKMYWCMDNRPGHNDGCGGYIPSSNIRGAVAICPHCNKAVNAKYLTDMLVFKLSTKKLAAKLAQIFYKLDGSADIYCKYDKTDMRTQAMGRDRGWDVANRLRGMHIYPLKNILKDTGHGSDLAGRIYAFLTA